MAIAIGSLVCPIHWVGCTGSCTTWRPRFALDAESVRQGREFASAEAEANAHANLGHDYLVLGEPARAFEHLQEAERIYGQDVWFRWRYNLRLQADLASYWITQGDLKVSAAHAATALQGAEATLSRKHLAWAHKLLGDIAALEERVDDGQRHYATALAVLQLHPCPTIEWKILKAARSWPSARKTIPPAQSFSAVRGRSCNRWLVP